MAAFHLSWLAFFAAFVSTFAPAALLPVIRDNIDLTKTDLGNAGIAAVCGAIAARVGMGSFVGELSFTYLLAQRPLACTRLLVVRCSLWSFLGQEQQPRPQSARHAADL